MASRFLQIMILLLAPLLLRGQDAAEVPEIERAIEHLELKQAAHLAVAMPEMKDRLYYQSRILFVKYLVTEDPSILPMFLARAKTSIQALDKMPESDPEKNVLIAEMFFLRGAAKALNKRYISAALDIKTSCNLISRNLRRFPDEPSQLKLLGIFHVAMGTVPRKMQWLGNVLCFKGDIDAGMQELEKAARPGTRLAHEAAILLFYFEKNLIDRPDLANARMEKLAAQYPDSRLYNYLLLSSYLELRENDRALALADKVQDRLDHNAAAETLPMWHYALAKAHFFKLEYGPCIAQLDRFLDTYKGKTLYADGLYRKGMALILSGNYPTSRAVFHALTKVEASGFDADEYASGQAAIYLLNAPPRVDLELYAARNLFDGGYYQRSLGKLAGLGDPTALTANQRAEYHYRQGRIWHALDSTDRAMRHYEKAMQTQPGRNLWMKVYAYYYAGQLMEAAGSLEKAETLFRKALDYDDYAYQAGLEQRCKAALYRLKRAKKSAQDG